MSDREISTVMFDKPVRMLTMGGTSSALEAKRLGKGQRIVIVEVQGESFVTVEGLADPWLVPLRRVDSMKLMPAGGLPEVKAPEPARATRKAQRAPVDDTVNLDSPKGRK
jgi:hypothetical protein